MNAVPSTSRTAAVVTQILLWAWLIGLSVFVGLGYRLMPQLAEREHLDAGLRQLQVLQTRLNELADDTKALHTRPEPATATALRNTRAQLDTRIAQLEQVLAGHATQVDLQALRTEVGQLRAQHQPAARASAPSRPTRATPAKPRLGPIPFRVIGAELRAGQRSIAVAPAAGGFTASQIQVLLPGEAVGRWRLQAIDGNTAIFQTGEQTRRLAIP